MGVYPIRVQTDDGISNPFLLAVGQLPQVAEKEDNSTFETAQAIPDPPLVIEGQVAGNDVDFFRFHGKKGQLIVVDAQCARIGSGIDPTIRLTTAAANRAYVASADDSPGLLTDARLTAVLPADGDYVVELSDSRYQGASRPVYRLVIGAVPMAEEIYPLGGRAGETVGLELRGGTFAGVKIAAATLNPPFGYRAGRAANLERDAGPVHQPAAHRSSTSNRWRRWSSPPYPEIREPTDPAAPPPRAVAPVVLQRPDRPARRRRRFVLAVTPGQRLRIKVQAYELGSALDGVLRVLGNGGCGARQRRRHRHSAAARRTQQPQSLVLPDPSLEFTIPGGTNEITLVLRDLENRGGIGFPYRIVVEPLFPDFQLQVNEPQVSVPRGGTAAVAGDGHAQGLQRPDHRDRRRPARGADRPPGHDRRGPDRRRAFAIGGRRRRVPRRSDQARRPRPRGQRPVRTARVQAGGLRPAGTSAHVHRSRNTAWSPPPRWPLPVTLDTPPAPIEVAHGLSATIPVKVARTKGSDGALAISPLPLPPGVTIAGATIADKAAEGKVTVNVGRRGPAGDDDHRLAGQGQVCRRGADLRASPP